MFTANEMMSCASSEPRLCPPADGFTGGHFKHSPSELSCSHFAHQIGEQTGQSGGLEDISGTSRRYKKVRYGKAWYETRRVSRPPRSTTPAPLLGYSSSESPGYSDINRCFRAPPAAVLK